MTNDTAAINSKTRFREINFDKVFQTNLTEIR